MFYCDGSIPGHTAVYGMPGAAKAKCCLPIGGMQCIAHPGIAAWSMIIAHLFPFIKAGGGNNFTGQMTRNEQKMKL